MKNQQNFDQQLDELEKQLADIFDLNDSSNGLEKANLNIEYSLI